MKARSRRILLVALIVAPLVSAGGFRLALRSSNGGIGTTVAAFAAIVMPAAVVLLLVQRQGRSRALGIGVAIGVVLLTAVVFYIVFVIGGLIACETASDQPCIT